MESIDKGIITACMIIMITSFSCGILAILKGYSCIYEIIYSSLLLIGILSLRITFLLVSKDFKL